MQRLGLHLQLYCSGRDRWAGLKALHRCASGWTLQNHACHGSLATTNPVCANRRLYFLEPIATPTTATTRITTTTRSGGHLDLATPSGPNLGPSLLNAGRGLECGLSGLVQCRSWTWKQQHQQQQQQQAQPWLAQMQAQAQAQEPATAYVHAGRAASPHVGATGLGACASTGRFQGSSAGSCNGRLGAPHLTTRASGQEPQQQEPPCSRHSQPCHQSHWHQHPHPRAPRHHLQLRHYHSQQHQNHAHHYCRQQQEQQQQRQQSMLCGAPHMLSGPRCLHSSRSQGLAAVANDDQAPDQRSNGNSSGGGSGSGRVRSRGGSGSGNDSSSIQGSGAAADRRQGEGEAAAGGAGASGGGGGGSGTRPLPLRAALRLLYKRVHPDLFHDQPRAKSENERSFKLLQEYVQLARGGDPRSPAARLPYRFVFYMREEPARVDLGEQMAAPRQPSTPPLRPPPGARTPAAAAGAAAPPAVPQPPWSDAAAADDGGEDAIPGLYCIKVTLPPPAISQPGHKDLAGSSRKALTKLLAACGLATSGRDGEEGGEGEGEGGAEGGPLSLAAFLPEAVEALRQAEAARPSDPAVRVANLRGALRLHRQVMVSFADKQLPPKAQVALLERLAGVVDAVPGLKLQGCHIVIGDRLGLDRLGHLCLAAGEPNDTWAAFLGGVDIPFALQQRRNVQALRNLEAQVAAAAGLAQLFTPYGNLTEPSYRSFLERLAAAAAVRGSVGGGSLREVSLCVFSPAPKVGKEEDGEGQEPPCRLDSFTAGVVQVSSDIDMGTLYDSLTKLGGEALAALRAYRDTEAQLRALADKTRQRLRLRSLTRDPRVAPHHFRRACGLLLDQAAAFTPLLEGCTLRVAFANRLAPDGSCIEIAHDCVL